MSDDEDIIRLCRAKKYQWRFFVVALRGGDVESVQLRCAEPLQRLTKVKKNVKKNKNDWIPEKPCIYVQ